MDGLLFSGKKKKHRMYTISRGTREVRALLPGLPGDNESFRLVSSGGFSSINLILYVAQETPINTLYASTLRVGKSHATALARLHDAGRLGSACFVVGSIMRHNVANSKDYEYDAYFDGLCARCGWHTIYANNHSKIILLDTARGKYVIETSSNLNDNLALSETQSCLIFIGTRCFARKRRCKKCLLSGTKKDDL